MTVIMASSDRLVRAAQGLADMDKGLTATLGAAALAIRDEDLPTESVPHLREAVRAVEFARKKVAMAVAGVMAAKKRMGKTDAD
jgi:hypothetical protein